MRTTSIGKTSAKFTCQFCHTGFVLETRYLQHKCKQMKRLEELQSPLGQAALGYYQEWMRAQQRVPPPASTFMDSRYYRTFVTFAQWAVKVALPHPTRFVRIMVDRKLPPTLWSNDEVYSMYLEYIDRVTTPTEQVNVSISTLMDIADRNSVDVSESISTLSVNDILQLIRQRKLSPWILLLSPSFKHKYVSEASDEQRLIIDTVIRADYWVDKFKEHTKDVENIRGYVKELGL